MSAWLEVLGRAHLMVLHLPIGFFLALAVLEFFSPAAKNPASRKASGWLVLVTLLSTLAAVATGLSHARDPEFAGSIFEWHRNLGLALVPLAAGAWFCFRREAFVAYRVALVAALALLVPAGHLGAQITHGEGFLTEPLTREAIVAPTKPAVVQTSSYDAVIRPLFDAKCTQCHGLKKQKAGLSLATQEKILAGGRHGPVLVATAPATSLMLTRIQLALDEDKHMPPQDHDQLAPAELAALQRWILAGAPFQGVVESLAAVTEAPAAPVATVQSAASNLATAAPAALDALHAALVHVQALSDGSPLLWVDFAAAAKSTDDASARALLTPIRAQLCELSLARSAVGDETLVMLAEFGALRKLDVRATAIGNPGVAAFAKHAKLAELVLSQNKLTDACVDNLIAMPALERVHLWRSGISPEGIARLREARPHVAVDDGAQAASTVLEAETAIVLTKSPPPQVPPVVASAAPSLVPINMKCPVTGAPVKSKYSIVYEGKVIGFCCPDCPKEFWADPAKFADHLQ